jgi:hypothetical protein
MIAKKDEDETDKPFTRFVFFVSCGKRAKLRDWRL